MNANAPLMPKATAVWLIENTALSFEQIADFCKMHALEIQALADEEGPRIIGQSPLASGELSREEIERCEKDPSGILIMKRNDLPQPKIRAKGPRYTPVSKRGDKPDAIAYLLKHHSELTDVQVTKLIGTTKTTIAAVRDRTHSNMTNIKPRNPVDLGLCTYVDLEAALEKARKAYEKQGKALPAKPAEVEYEDTSAKKSSGFDFSNFLGTGSGSGNH